jgi:hypothetical protein
VASGFSFIGPRKTNQPYEGLRVYHPALRLSKLSFDTEPIRVQMLPGSRLGGLLAPDGFPVVVFVGPVRIGPPLAVKTTAMVTDCPVAMIAGSASTETDRCGRSDGADQMRSHMQTCPACIPV